MTGTVPTGLWILGQSFRIQSWRDVLEQTLNTIAELEPVKFGQIMQQFPHFVGRDRGRFREVRELKSGAFIEVNLAAESIRRFCYLAIEAIELTTEDWRVEVA